MSAMEALSRFLSSIYSMSLVFFTLLLLELLALVRSLTGSKPKFDRRVITTAQYMKLIERTCPTTRFAAAAAGDPSSPECRVCLAEFEGGDKVRRLQCGHVFHRECLDTWLQLHQATCPLCRTKVLPDDVVESYRRMRDQVEFDGHDEELIFFLSALHGNSFHRLYF